MTRITILLLLFLSAYSQMLIPIKFKYFENKAVDSLSVYIKQNNNFYHSFNFIQKTSLKIENGDTLIHRYQSYDAVAADMTFYYDVDIKQNLVPAKIVLTTDDSLETHVLSHYAISTFTKYSNRSKTRKDKIDINEVVFEDNNVDLILSQLSIKKGQSLSIPLFLTEDYKIENVMITFTGFFELNIKNRIYEAKQFRVKGSDFTQYYWLDIKTNALLQFESVENQIIMIKQNAN